MIVVYRLHSSRYPPGEGFGAAMYGGRWNPPGIRAIYTAASRSLAVLEILVNYAILPADFVMTTVHIPNRVKIEEVPRSLLAPGWQDTQTITQILGKTRLAQAAVLCAPSAIIPEENNYVINPEHADFARIEFVATVAFRFDARLK